MKSHRTFGFNSNLVETVFAFQHDGWGSPNIFSRRQLYLLLPESLRTPTTTRTRRRSPALPHVVHSPPVHILRVVQHTTMAFCVSTAAHTRVPTSTSRNVQSRKVTSTITRASLSEPTGVTRDDGASESSEINRRGLFAAAALATVAPASNLATPAPAFAEEISNFTTYRDEEDKYAFSVPASWTQAEGVTSSDPRSTRRVVAFYPLDSPDINVNVVATAVGADYPKMGSFGSPDEFAYGVAAGMTKPKPKEGPKQFSYVLDAKSVDAKYTLEYTVERPTEDFYQHLYSVVGIGYNGRVNRFFTLTCVCPEDKYESVKDTFKQIAGTFETPPTLYP